LNWTSGLDATGRPQNVVSPTSEGTIIYPGNQGGTDWYSPSFSPRTGLFYIPSWMDTYSTYIKRPTEYVEGQRFTGALPVMSVRRLQQGPLVNRRLPEEGYGAMLWKASVGGAVSSGPMAYAIAGRQHIAVSAGNAIFVYALRQ
jgi:alcohol dehydrogenase (cytochrome c)